MKSSALRVRAATEEDLALLSGLLAPLPLFAAYQLTAARLAERWVAGLRQGQGLLVAHQGAELLGMCWFLEDGTFATGAYLRTIAVVPGRQGNGVGLLLLEAFEQGAGAPTGGWFLLASDFNAGAHRFYIRHGYREVGRIPGFAAKDVTERIFWKARRD